MGREFKLHTYRYPSQTGETKGVVYYQHGYAEYAGRYAYFAKTLAENGYDVISHDAFAHGRSEGEPRAYFTSVNEHLEDSWNLID